MALRDASVKAKDKPFQLGSGRWLLSLLNTSACKQDTAQRKHMSKISNLQTVEVPFDVDVNVVVDDGPNLPSTGDACFVDGRTIHHVPALIHNIIT